MATVVALLCAAGASCGDDAEPAASTSTTERIASTEAPTTSRRPATTTSTTTTTAAPVTTTNPPRAPIACPAGQVLSEVFVRIEGKTLRIDWTASRPLSPSLHGFYVTVDSLFQLGVKMVDGADVFTFLADFSEGGQNEYLDPPGATDGQRASMSVPLSKMKGVDRLSTWQAAATENGEDIGECPAEKQPIG